MTYPTADFQKEMFSLMENKNLDLVVIAAARNFSKSTICNTAFAIWAVVSGRYHNVILASQTVPQVRVHFRNVRYALEGNTLLKNDLGPFMEEAEEWGLSSIIFGNYEARITPVSVEQSIRGNIYKHYRPDLIILDDIEDLKSTRTKEARQKLWEFFLSEIMPLGTPHTKIVVLGNFLHEYSLVGTLMREIEQGTRLGVCRRYPLLDNDGKCLWPGMYPTPESIEAFKKKIGDEPTWQREMLLKIIEGDSKLITLDQIHFYDVLSPKDLLHGYLYTWVGVDFAIGQNEWNDSTAMVTVQVYCIKGKLKIYVLPNVINRKMDFHQTTATMQQILDNIGEADKTKMIMEANGFQEIYYQYVFGQGYHQVVPVKVSDDKLTRIQPIIKLIKDGTIAFPRGGAQELITQLIGFGYELHEDACDSLSLVVQKIVEDFELNNRSQSYFDFNPNGPYITINRVARIKLGRKWVIRQGAELRPWQEFYILSIPEDRQVNENFENGLRVEEALTYFFQIKNLYDLADLPDFVWRGDRYEPEAPKIYLFANPKDFPRYLPGLIKAFGTPFEQNEEIVSWNVLAPDVPGCVIEAYLLDPDAEEPNLYMRLQRAIYTKPGAYGRYNVALHGSLRDYMRRKFMIINTLVKGVY